MNILITGGTGLLGKAIINHFNKEGKNKIYILTRNDPSKFKENSGTIKYIKWDNKNLELWIANIIDEYIDVVINLAGLSIVGGIRWNKSRKKELRDSRINSGKILVELIKKMKIKPKLFIQASGINYYPYSQDEQTEDSKPETSIFIGKLVQDWEDSTKEIELLSIRRVIIRIAPVLTTKGGVLKLTMLPYKLLIGGRMTFFGNQWFSWIHIDDFVKFIAFTISNDSINGAYNLCSPFPVQYKELNSSIGRLLKRPWFFHVPKIIIKIFIGEKGDLLVNSLRIKPYRLLNEEKFVFKYPEIDIALKNLIENKK